MHLAVDPILPASTPLEDQTLSAAVGVVTPSDGREISQDIAVSVTANPECQGQRTPHQTVCVGGRLDDTSLNTNASVLLIHSCSLSLCSGHC